MEDALSYNSINYNDEEFLSSFKITQNSFFLLLAVMKEKKAFKRTSKKKKIMANSLPTFGIFI